MDSYGIVIHEDLSFIGRELVSIVDDVIAEGVLILLLLELF